MSENYLNQIKQLVELQKIDDEIFEVKQTEEQAPLNLRDLENRFNEVGLKRERIQDKLDHLTEQQKRLLLEIEDDSARLKKSRNKLMQVGNDRDYQLMQREVENMEKTIRTRDEEKMAIQEELNIQNANYEESDKQYTSIKSQLETLQTNLQKTLEDCRMQLVELNKKRELAAQFIPKEIFQRYEFIRKRLEHPVIVEVDEGICSGCNIAIPPQKYIDLQAGQHIQDCPNCQRLIFWSQHFGLPSKRRKINQETAEDNADDNMGNNPEDSFKDINDVNDFEDADSKHQD